MGQVKCWHDHDGVVGTIEPAWGDLGDVGIGLVESESRQITPQLMLFIHSVTRGQTHMRKAWENQRPINIVLLVQWVARNNSMAAPNRTDFVLMSCFPPSVAQACQS